MILSSSDILKILSSSQILRMEATVKIVDGRPPLSGTEGTIIYVDRFPRTEEFQATWTLYIESDDEVELVIAELKRLLPSVQVSYGLMTTVTTTDFRSESTQTAPEAPRARRVEIDLSQYEERFQALIEDVQDQMLLVHSGRNGKDGRDGADGRDGRDLLATEATLFDLQDVERGIPLQKGQVLTWDGREWTNLYVPQLQAIIGGGGGGGTGDGEGVIISDTAPTTRDDGSELQEGDQWWDSSTGVMYVWYVDADSSQWVQSSGGDGGGSSTTLAGLLDTDTSGVEDGELLVYRSATGNWTAEPAPETGIPEAPQDGEYYVRKDGAWVSLKTALDQYGITVDDSVDGGNFTTGASSATNTTVIDGGNFTTGTGAAATDGILDAGNWTTGDSGSTYGF